MDDAEVLSLYVVHSDYLFQDGTNKMYRLSKLPFPLFSGEDRLHIVVFIEVGAQIFASS